jgi:hypothetical protein
MERYLPQSAFLRDVINGSVDIESSPDAKAKLREVIALMTDADSSNRDWATFIIASMSDDDPDIRAALLIAADDRHPDVRDEAIVGLARRDRDAALERLRPLLSQEIGVVLLEAAAILGDRSLVPALEEMNNWEGSSADTRKRLEVAIAACRQGSGIDSGQGQYRLSRAR